MRLIDVDDIVGFAAQYETFEGVPLTEREKLLIVAFASTIKHVKKTGYYLDEDYEGDIKCY